MSQVRYTQVPVNHGRAMISATSRDMLGRVDAIVFDCDGVLVDARGSYDTTIRLVVEEMVKGITGVSVDLEPDAPRLISRIRRTGGFNNDWDTAYALALFSVASLADGDRFVVQLDDIVNEFSSTPRARGKRSVDAFLEARGMKGRRAEAIGRAREYLGYPGSPPGCRMTTLFDEVYFGGSLFKEAYGVDARSGRKKGLIEAERVLVKESTLERLETLLGRRRLAIITGRPSLGTEHTLDRMMNYFDKDASTFIGDADIRPELAAEFDKYRKPSGMALVRAQERLSSKVLLYVGDSAEDMIMARDAKDRSSKETLFAAVYQTAAEADEQVSFFERGGCDAILESVDLLPAMLEETRN